MINYMVDSENVGTKWIPYLKENIKKTDRVFLFYTDKSPTIPCGKLNDLTLFIHQIQSIHCSDCSHRQACGVLIIKCSL